VASQVNMFTLSAAKLSFTKVASTGLPEVSFIDTAEKLQIGACRWSYNIHQSLDIVEVCTIQCVGDNHHEIAKPPWRVMELIYLQYSHESWSYQRRRTLATGSSNVMVSWPASRSKSKLSSIGEVVSPVKLKAWIARPSLVAIMSLPRRSLKAEVSTVTNVFIMEVPTSKFAFKAGEDSLLHVSVHCNQYGMNSSKYCAWTKCHERHLGNIRYVSLKLMPQFGTPFRNAFVARLCRKPEGFFRKSEGFFRESESFFRRIGRLHPKSAGLVHT